MSFRTQGLSVNKSANRRELVYYRTMETRKDVEATQQAMQARCLNGELSDTEFEQLRELNKLLDYKWSERRARQALRDVRNTTRRMLRDKQLTT